jgi:hypothetical protein
MAKMFYTLDEVKTSLGRNEEEIKQYTREGRLREFRDGQRTMFKADQVEALKAELGGGGARPSAPDQIDLGISDTGAPIGLVDSRASSGSQSGISLVDTDAGRSGTGVGSGLGSGLGGSGVSSGTGAVSLKEDTALAADLGLGGSIGGTPSPRGGSTAGGSPPSGSVAGAKSGIIVLGPDESHADPMAQTAIGAGSGEQVSMESVGSGSGLLDLTSERDDTSLGAELLDEIAPGGSTGRKAALTDSSQPGAASPTASATSRRSAVGTPVYVEAPDASAGFFGGLALGGFVMLLLGTLALMGVVIGAKPALIGQLKGEHMFPIIAGAGVIVALVLGILGLVLGKVMR